MNLKYTFQYVRDAWGSLIWGGAGEVFDAPGQVEACLFGLALGGGDLRSGVCLVYEVVQEHLGVRTPDQAG